MFPTLGRMRETGFTLVAISLKTKATFHKSPDLRGTKFGKIFDVPSQRDPENWFDYSDIDCGCQYGRHWGLW